MTDDRMTPPDAGGAVAARALVIEHQPDAPAGVLQEWLDDRGFDARLWRPDAEPGAPDPAGFGLIVSLGSKHAVYDGPGWIETEVGLLQDAASRGVPVLGICFGAQALATALGGEVAAAPRAEIGWIDVESDDPRGLPPGPWFAWHSDRCSLPAGATEVARNAMGVQGFRHGPHLGVQFHPEITPQIVDGWIAALPDQLAARGLDPGDLRRATARRAASAKASAYRLFDAFWARARGSTSTR